MTRPRLNPDKLLFGILGTLPDSGATLSRWTAYFRSHTLDASIDRYPATEKTIPERLSEMFHFDRRGYIVGKSLQKAIIPYLDRLDSSVTKEAPNHSLRSGTGQGSVDTVLNDGGMMIGFFCANDDDKRSQIWKL